MTTSRPCCLMRALLGPDPTMILARALASPAGVVGSRGDDGGSRHAAAAGLRRRRGGAELHARGGAAVHRAAGAVLAGAAARGAPRREALRAHHPTGRADRSRRAPAAR